MLKCKRTEFEAFGRRWCRTELSDSDAADTLKRPYVEVEPVDGAPVMLRLNMFGAWVGEYDEAYQHPHRSGGVRFEVRTMKSPARVRLIDALKWASMIADRLEKSEAKRAAKLEFARVEG